MSINVDILNEFTAFIEKRSQAMNPLPYTANDQQSSSPAGPGAQPSEHVDVANVTSGQGVPRVAATNTPVYANPKPATTPGKKLTSEFTS